MSQVMARRLNRTNLPMPLTGKVCKPEELVLAFIFMMPG